MGLKGTMQCVRMNGTEDEADVGFEDEGGAGLSMGVGICPLWFRWLLLLLGNL